jgi:hypothetical protein
MKNYPVLLERKIENRLGKNYFLKVMIASLIGVILLFVIGILNEWKDMKLISALIFSAGEKLYLSLLISSIGLLYSFLFSVPLYILYFVFKYTIGYFLSSKVLDNIVKTLFSSAFILYLLVKFFLIVTVVLYFIYGTFVNSIEKVDIFFVTVLTIQFGLSIPVVMGLSCGKINDE